MTSPADISPYRGETQLIEQAARDAAAYLPAEDEDQLGAARGVANGILISALIVGVPVLAWMALS